MLVGSRVGKMRYGVVYVIVDKVRVGRAYLWAIGTQTSRSNRSGCPASCNLDIATPQHE
jgi:hypothetical protein